jgi:putative Mg2+ transporter-C (MgtC) family protein
MAPQERGDQNQHLGGGGATAFGLISELGFGPTNNPAQVASGVVAGIGFIGAGVIMRRGSSVQGINSAATLWATASMGLAIGAGRIL